MSEQLRSPQESMSHGPLPLIVDAIKAVPLINDIDGSAGDENVAASFVVERAQGALGVQVEISELPSETPETPATHYTIEVWEPPHNVLLDGVRARAQFFTAFEIKTSPSEQVASADNGRYLKLSGPLADMEASDAATPLEEITPDATQEQLETLLSLAKADVFEYLARYSEAPVTDEQCHEILELLAACTPETRVDAPGTT